MLRGWPGSYRLRMNESEIEAEIHTLRDGGLLMQASIFSLYHFFRILIFIIVHKFVASWFGLSL